MNTESRAQKNDMHLREPFAFFWHVSKPHWRFMVAAMLLVILASAASQSTSYFFKLIVDAVEVGDTAAAVRWGLLYPVAILIVQLLYRASGQTGARWTVFANTTAADTLNRKILSHGHNYFINRFSGSITSKVRHVTGAIENVLPDFLWAQLNTLVTFLVTFLFLLFVSPFVATIFVVLLVVLFVVNALLAPKKTELAKLNAEAATEFQGRAVDVITNVSAVRQYVRREHEYEGLVVLSKKKRNAALANWIYTERMLLINSLILFVAGLLMFYVVIRAWEVGSITTGDLVMVVALISQITGSLLFIGRAFNATARAIGEMREGLQDIYVPSDVPDAPGAPALVVSGGEVRWQNVSFTFGENQVFDNFSLTIAPGERVGLVGSSGAGKSTFVSLLVRQYDLGSGIITIDNQNIATVRQDSLRQAIAVVPQEPMLFHRTIRDNILYGNPHASSTEVELVAKKAQAHDFIVKLPLGYETLVGERGVKLSGGQKQRVAIARAMLKDAPILVLDEATSALDSESEVAIQQALHALMAGKTVIAIAHRLSTLREMDRIIVLEEGKIVEDGSHDALLTYDGVYARLWKHQSGGFV